MSKSKPSANSDNVYSNNFTSDGILFHRIKLRMKFVNDSGMQWQNVEPPMGAQLKQISVGLDVVWALDTMGRLSVRREIQSNVFPEGTHWQTLPTMPNDPIHMGILLLLS
jgi:hypothetical protein